MNSLLESFEIFKKVNLTPYHTKYFAYELTKHCSSDSVEQLAGTFINAQVELNLNQVKAALFAFRSSLYMGALLADEFGLKKTNKVRLVLYQKWAEKKRKIIIIAPANFHNQWYQKLSEKFFLPYTILELKSFNTLIKQWLLNSFESKEIVICLYHFAKNKANDVQRIPWDLVVIDEAHRLQNEYKPSNVIANTLKIILASRNKILLYFMPLQNSLFELSGLFYFTDKYVLDDLNSFREQIVKKLAQKTLKQLFFTIRWNMR